MTTSRRKKVGEEVNLQKPSHNDLSIPELAQQIEDRKVDPKIFDKVALRKCAIFFKRRAYSNEDIAEILGVSSRTAMRYLRKIRAENSLKLGVNFQQELLGGILNNLKLRYQRLLRLSYSCNLSDYERARIVLMCHQVEMDGITLLNRLGYMSKEQGMEEVNLIKEKAEEEHKRLKGEIKKQLEALTVSQDNALRERWTKLYNEAMWQLEKMVEKFTAENEKRKKGVSQLVCSVTVLCN